MKVLLFTKDTEWCRIVGRFCEQHFDTTWIRGVDSTQSYTVVHEKVDYVISYLSPWILPTDILELAQIAAINFHPGPPKYPGIGGYNFALYNGDAEYGVVCHIMEEKVDSGKIIRYKKFKIVPGETIASLKEKSMAYLLSLWYDFWNNPEIEFDGIKWDHNPYTRKDLQKLCELGLTFEDQIKIFPKWYTACYFPNAKDKPHIIAEGTKYYIIREDHYDGGYTGGYYNTT